MKRFAFALGIVFLSSWAIFAQAPKTTKVDRLCGYLVRETQEGRESISQQKIALYRREPAIECCNERDRIVQLPTKKDGKFEFKHMPAGNYWIATTVENHEYKMAIDFAPDRDAQDCTWNLYTIRKNEEFVLLTYLDIKALV